MPDVLVYSTCNQFAHGVLAIAAGPEKLVRSRIVPAKPNFERHSARISHGKENGVVLVGRVGNLAAQPHLFLATR